MLTEAQSGVEESELRERALNDIDDIQAKTLALEWLDQRFGHAVPQRPMPGTGGGHALIDSGIQADPTLPTVRDAAARPLKDAKKTTASEQPAGDGL